MTEQKNKKSKIFNSFLKGGPGEKHTEMEEEEDEDMKASEFGPSELSARGNGGLAAVCANLPTIHLHARIQLQLCEWLSSR